MTTTSTTYQNAPAIRIETPIHRGIEVGRRPGCYGVEMPYATWTIAHIYYPTWAPNTPSITWFRYFNGIVVNDGSTGGLKNIATQYEYAFGEKFDPAILAQLDHAAAA